MSRRCRLAAMIFLMPHAPAGCVEWEMGVGGARLGVICADGR